MRRRFCALSACVAAAALLWSEASAQQPGKAPALPPISPSSAGLDQTVNGLDGPGFAVAGDPDADNHLLAAACEGGTIHCFHRDVIRGVRAGDRTCLVLEGHQGPVMALAWCRGYRLASGGADKKIVLWQMPEGTPLQTLAASAVVRALAASPDGSLLASTGGADVQLWDAGTGRAVAKLTGPADWTLCLAFSPDGTRLAGGGYDGHLRVWEVPSGRKLLDVPVRPPAPPQATPPPVPVVWSVAFSPDGKQLAVGGADARIHLVNTADGKLVRSLSGHVSSVSALAFHPAGTVLVSGSKDRTVRLWNPANGQLLKTLEGHTSWVQGLALLEKGTRIASVGADQTVRLWDLAQK